MEILHIEVTDVETGKRHTLTVKKPPTGLASNATLEDGTIVLKQDDDNYYTKDGRRFRPVK